MNTTNEIKSQPQMTPGGYQLRNPESSPSAFAMASLHSPETAALPSSPQMVQESQERLNPQWVDHYLKTLRIANGATGLATAGSLMLLAGASCYASAWFILRYTDIGPEDWTDLRELLLHLYRSSDVLNGIGTAAAAASAITGGFSHPSLTPMTPLKSAQGIALLPSLKKTQRMNLSANGLAIGGVVSLLVAGCIGSSSDRVLGTSSASIDAQNAFVFIGGLALLASAITGYVSYFHSKKVKPTITAYVPTVGETRNAYSGLDMAKRVSCTRKMTRKVGNYLASLGVIPLVAGGGCYGGAVSVDNQIQKHWEDWTSREIDAALKKGDDLVFSAIALLVIGAFSIVGGAITACSSKCCCKEEKPAATAMAPGQAPNAEAIRPGYVPAAQGNFANFPHQQQFA